MSKFDIRPEFECQNRILNIKIRYSPLIRMSKWDFGCKNSIFGPNSNVKIGIRMSKFDIQSKFEYQNKILNVKIRYLARTRMSK